MTGLEITLIIVLTFTYAFLIGYVARGMNYE